jgi:ankyrin repeat protein
MSYASWTKEELKAECAKRGLKATGAKDLLLERLETWDACHARGQEHEGASRKRKAVSEEEQRELDAGLLHAAKSGSLPDVCEALSGGTNVNCVNDERRSPLMLACRRQDDWSVAEAIVRELLSAGTVLDMCTQDMEMAIHLAAQWSSCAVVTLLLEAKSLVDPETKLHNTPLSTCCFRGDEEAVKIARLLLERGAQIEHCGEYARTPLLNASRRGTAAVVELLLSRGADIRAVDEDGNTALHLAACNRLHGLAIIPLLVKAGVDVNALDVDGRTALFDGLNSNADTMRALAPLYQPARQLDGVVPSDYCPDPIGCFQEGLRFGVSLSGGGLRNAFSYAPPAYAWATMRACAVPIAKVFDAVEHCANPAKWRWAGLEMRTPRNPDTNGTLLHLAAESNNAAAVQALTGIWLNPLLRDGDGKLAVADNRCQYSR